MEIFSILRKPDESIAIWSALKERILRDWTPGLLIGIRAVVGEPSPGQQTPDSLFLGKLQSFAPQFLLQATSRSLLYSNVAISFSISSMPLVRSAPPTTLSTRIRTKSTIFGNSSTSAPVAFHSLRSACSPATWSRLQCNNNGLNTLSKLVRLSRAKMAEQRTVRAKSSGTRLDVSAHNQRGPSIPRIPYP
ncbi:hypothetical protein KCU88_g454, partial [Aureobasidium melanogenum]